MNKKKLDSLLWENIPFGNIMILDNDAIKQENLDEVFWDDLDELSVSRDEDYNIKITCVRNLNKFKNNKQRNVIPQNDFVPGEVVPSWRLEVKKAKIIRLLFLQCITMDMKVN